MVIKRISLTPEDFLKILNENSDNIDEDFDYKYQEIDTHLYDDYLEIPNELSNFKANYNGVIDASKLKRSEVKNLIWDYANIKINNFTIKIVKYYFSRFMTKKSEILMDISIYEDTLTQINGINIPKRIRFRTDKRFKDQSWVSPKSEVTIAQINDTTVGNIIDHIFMISRLKAFI